MLALEKGDPGGCVEQDLAVSVPGTQGQVKSTRPGMGEGNTLGEKDQNGLYLGWDLGHWAGACMGQRLWGCRCAGP